MNKHESPGVLFVEVITCFGGKKKIYGIICVE
jgi:hypothetical protein